MQIDVTAAIPRSRVRRVCTLPQFTVVLVACVSDATYCHVVPYAAGVATR